MQLITLSKVQVMAIHDAIIEHEGGLKADYNTSKLEGVLGRIDAIQAYSPQECKDVFDLAAIYAEILARGHAFPDGNKRTATACALTVLWLNLPIDGMDFEAIKANVAKVQDSSYFTELMVAVAEGKVGRKQIKANLMTMFALGTAIAGVGFIIFKLIDSLVNLFKR